MERWRIKEDGRVGGSQRVGERGSEGRQGGGPVPGARRGLPGAHEAGRASSSSQRPGSSNPGRRWREEGPQPLRPGTSATLARGSHSMATRRFPGTPASRRGRARVRDAGGRCGGDWAPRTGAQRGRRGGGGPGRIRGQGPLARRPRRSAPSRASQPLPGNARPRSGRRAPPPGRPGACLLAARWRARRVPGPALPQDPPLRSARGTAPPRTNTAPGRLWKNSRKPRDAGDHSSRAAQAERAAGVCAGRLRSRTAERTKPKEVGLSSPEPAYRKGWGGSTHSSAHPLPFQRSATLRRWVFGETWAYCPELRSLQKGAAEPQTQTLTQSLAFFKESNTGE